MAGGTGTARGELPANPGMFTVWCRALSPRWHCEGDRVEEPHRALSFVPSRDRGRPRSGIQDALSSGDQGPTAEHGGLLAHTQKGRALTMLAHCGAETHMHTCVLGTPPLNSIQGGK